MIEKEGKGRYFLNGIVFAFHPPLYGEMSLFDRVFSPRLLLVYRDVDQLLPQDVIGKREYDETVDNSLFIGRLWASGRCCGCAGAVFAIGYADVHHHRLAD